MYYYAFVQIREFGEPEREVRIGPFGPFDAETGEDELRENLERRGDWVNVIVPIDPTNV
jgi:hypothetical protein